MRQHHNPKKETVIFLHIPKTAGTTLDQIIFRQYRRKKIYETGLDSHQGVQDFIGMSETERASYRLLKGHLNFGIHKNVPPPWAYFTFLREPIDRTISHFYFIAKSNNHALYDLIHENNMDLKDYIDAAVDPMLFNAQTRFLSGVWDRNPAGTCTPQHLEQAKVNLKNHIKVIGLTERFDESLLLLKQAFGWHTLIYTRHNVTGSRPGKEKLDADVLTAVENANQLDLELYDFALPLFEEQIQKFGPDFQKKLRKFQQNNKVLDPLGKIYWEMRKKSVRVYLRKQLESLST